MIKNIGDYVERAQDDARLKRTTHTYIADMFRDYNCKPEVLFPSIRGNRDQIELINQYFLGGSDFGSLSERLLLFLGPNGTGKTTMCNDLKRDLIAYSKTDTGLAYAIQGCPFNQHPFDIIPQETRKELQLVWHEDAAPCPVCEVTLDKSGKGWESLPVTRFTYGPRKGLAEHTASDARREDITEFLGDIDYSMVQHVKGSKANPEAYDWAGKFVWANRGIIDWDEILKSRRQLLTPLLMLTQSKIVAYPKFPKMHIDTVVIGATNWGEYQEAIKDKLLEPLFGRAFVIEFFYTLKQQEEAEIVQLRAKQMAEYSKFRGDASLSCFNDAILQGYISNLIVKTREESQGRAGLPPRVTLDIFSNAYMNATRGKKTCISFEDYRESYDRVLCSEETKHQNVGIKLNSAKDAEVQKEIAASLWKDITGMICSSSEEFKRIGQARYLDYLNTLEKKRRGARLSELEEKLLKDVADWLITESQKRIQDRDSFESIFIERLDEYKREHYTNLEKFRPVINALVSNEVRTIVRNYSYDVEVISEAERLLVEDVVNAMSRKKGHCKECAHELVLFLGENL